MQVPLYTCASDLGMPRQLRAHECVCVCAVCAYLCACTRVSANYTCRPEHTCLWVHMCTSSVCVHGDTCAPVCLCVGGALPVPILASGPGVALFHRALGRASCSPWGLTVNKVGAGTCHRRPSGCGGRRCSWELSFGFVLQASAAWVNKPRST